MAILKRAFSSGFSGVLVPLFYGLGVLAWFIALVLDPNKQSTETYSVFFGIAATFFCVGLIWMAGWLWTHHFFGPSRGKRKYSRRYSDQQSNPHSDIQTHAYAEIYGDRRRRKPRPKQKFRWFVVSFLTLVSLVVDRRLFNSYEVHISDVQVAHVEVFLVLGKERIRAEKVPIIGEAGHAKEMTFALAGLPTQEVAVPEGGKSIRIKVIVRNISQADIFGAHLRIDSDVPIKPDPGEMASVSDTQMGTDITELRPFKKASDEQSYMVDMPVPTERSGAGMLVSIESPDLRPYAAAAKITLDLKH